jgi:competence protein ComGC
MRTKQDSRRGFTLIESLIMIAVLMITLFAFILPRMARAKVSPQYVRCQNQLKWVALSFRQWALDNNDKYPMQVSIRNGGAREWTEQGFAGPVFQVMSNELYSPRLLLCPHDPVRTNFTGLTWNLGSSNLSYFVAPDADETQPQMILIGDSDLEMGGGSMQSGLMSLLTNSPVGWSAARHNRQGNLGLSDGSVQVYTTAGLRAALTNTGNWENRIVVP